MQTFADSIAEAFALRGADTYGEHVSQLEHALQCASIAEKEAAGYHLVAAALLHDYGHLIEGRGEAAERDGVDARHEIHGARALSAWFGPEVVGPIALHVPAKRYLCAVEADYEAALSPASRLSLRLQGGRFTQLQCRRFEQKQYFADAIRLRRWDDLGKAAGCTTRSLQHYLQVLISVSSAA